METVILVIHLMVVLALIVVVLLQRSEGGGLGMGGSGAGFMSSRGTANALTRTTAILAGIFFLTSILLAVFATQARGPRSILDRPAAGAPAVPGAPTSAPASGNALDQLKSLSPPPQPSGSQPPQPPSR